VSHLAISPLRYPGGKSKAIDKILPHVPADIGEFREPFVGGGSVFLAIKKLFRGRINAYAINDLNPDVAHFWRCLRDLPRELIDGVTQFRDGYSDGRALYEFLLDEKHMRSDLDRAVRFFVMNRITFSGVMDAGGYSQQAYERRFTLSSIERLQTAADYMSGTVITNDDYAPIIHAPGNNVFIFLDPPYWKAVGSKLYGARGHFHTTFDHERFAAEMQKCSHRWLITLDDSEKVRSLFSFAEIVAWELQYGMNNYKQATAAKGQELFIKNY